MKFPTFAFTFEHKAASVLLCAIVSILISPFCLAQPEIQWQKSYGGTSAEAAYSIRQTILGEYIVAGYSASDDGDVSHNHGGNDYWILFLHIDGEIIWEENFGGSNEEIATAINYSHRGGYVVAGYTNSNDGDVTGLHGNYDYWILELDYFGNLLWQKCLGGYSTDYAYDIHPVNLFDYRGEYIITGLSQSNSGDVTGHHGSTFYADYWVVRTDSLGNIIWQKSLGGSGGDVSHSMCNFIDNEFIISGYSNSTDGDITSFFGYDDSWLVRLSPGGNIEWQRCYGGSMIDRAYSVVQTHDCGFAFAGLSYSHDGDVSENKGMSDFWIVKLDYWGNIQWERSYGGSYEDVAQSIEQTDDRGFIIAGYSRSNDGDVSVHHGSVSTFDYWIVKLDSTGELEWEKTLGGSLNDQAYSITQTNDGGYIVAGRSQSTDGDITSSRGEYDMWIVKLAPYVMNIKETPSRPLDIALSAHPNPFNSAVTIALDGVGDGSPVPFDVEIYDVNGRMVEGGTVGAYCIRPFDGSTRLTPTIQEYIWSPHESLPSGVYLVRARIDRNVVEKRVIYLK
jgi:hypothetical protein